MPITSDRSPCRGSEVTTTKWDLVVIDEAHRLRNVYKPSNVIANELKQALKDTPKLLLTATPLQNSLLELFGLVNFVDEHTFEDLKGFREQFANLTNDRTFFRHIPYYMDEIWGKICDRCRNSHNMIRKVTRNSAAQGHLKTV